MAKKKGMLLTCDRCGATTFLLCNGEGELDGGFTRWNKFEPTPPGWGSYAIREREYMDLCPECSREWTKMRDEIACKFTEVCNG